MKQVIAKFALLGILAASFAGAVSASAAEGQKPCCAVCCKDGQCKMGGKCCK